MPRDGLTAQQRTFITAYVYQGENGTAAAKAAGYAPRSAEVTASRMLSIAKVQEEVARLTAERNAALKAASIRELDNRIQDYQLLRDALAATKAARAADPALAQVPGGASGVVVMTRKTIPNPDPRTAEARPLLYVEESKIDAGMVTQWLNVLKQAAVELGQWDVDADKRDLPNGSQIREIVIREVRYGNGGAAGTTPTLGDGGRTVRVSLPSRTDGDVG